MDSIAWQSTLLLLLLLYYVLPKQTKPWLMFRWWTAGMGRGEGTYRKELNFFLIWETAAAASSFTPSSPPAPVCTIHLAYLAMDLWAELLSRLIKFIKNARHNNNNHIARQRSHWRLAATSTATAIATATAKLRSAVCSPKHPFGQRGPHDPQKSGNWKRKNMWNG